MPGLISNWEAADYSKMKVLIVARCKNGKYAPFITEQVEAVQKLGVECKFFGIVGKGIIGYIRQLPRLEKAIREFRPDLIHAHYGLSGLLANYQRNIPVITTYHGSDINDNRVLQLSKKAIKRSRFNIFVSQKNVDTAKPMGDYALIPCGINLEDYPLIDKTEARRIMGLDYGQKYILFPGSFDNPVKNANLAKDTLKEVPEIKLLELKGYTRVQVITMMQAVDAMLLTSFSEGSPQVIKEALACGCPIVSVDVGDVAERVSGIDGCYVTSSNAASLTNALTKALAFGKRTRGRDAILRDGLTNDLIASRLINIYKACVK